MCDADYSSLFSAKVRNSVYFEPVIPTNFSSNLTSYFGGQPRLPEHIDWPIAEMLADVLKGDEKKNVAANFIAQIDLSELPKGGAAELPDQGTLFFFAVTENDALNLWAEPVYQSVIYYEGSTKDAPFRREPQNISLCYGESWSYRFDWLENIRKYGFSPPTSFPKFGVKSKIWEVEDIYYYGPTESQPNKNSNKHTQKSLLSSSEELKLIYNYYSKNLSAKNRQKNWSSYCENLKQTSTSNYSPDSHSSRLFRRQDKSLTWTGDENYPYHWIDIEIFCGLLQNEITKARENTIRFFHLFDKFRKTQKEVANWLWNVKISGQYNSVDDSHTMEFRNWLISLVDQSDNQISNPFGYFNISRHLAQSFRHGSCLAISNSKEAIGIIPQCWIDNQRWQWSIRTDNRTSQHILLPSRNESPRPQEGDDDIRLLKLDTQSCFFWVWADMNSIEFWINKNDLKEHKFSKCFVKYAPS